MAMNGNRIGHGILWLWLLLRLPVVYVRLLVRPKRGPGECHCVPSLEALLPNESSPSLGDDVHPAGRAERVPEPPRLLGAVHEVDEHANTVGHHGVAVQKQVLLGVVLRHDEAVELADVAGRQHLLEKMFPHLRRRWLRTRCLPQARPHLVGRRLHLQRRLDGHGLEGRRLERKLAVVRRALR